MDTLAFKHIFLDQINGDFPYRLRYRLEDEGLGNSIREKGLLHPLILDRDKHILSGHKRFIAAQELGIEKVPCLIYEKALPRPELFLLALVSNWNQNLTDLDRAYGIRKAVTDFNFGEAEAVQKVLPLLGLPADERFLKEYFSVSRLNAAILRQIDLGQVPFRGAQRLSKFDDSDQKIFGEIIFPACALTSNQLMLAADWFLDLKRRDQKMLSEIISAKDFKEIFAEKKTDRKQKGEQFFFLLRTLRFPRLMKQEKDFQASLEPLKKEAKQISVEAPPYFEDEGYTIRLRVRRREDVASLLRKLEDQKDLLNSLFDIIL